MLGIILIFILALALLGTSPVWSYSRHWGYIPTTGVGLILHIAMVLLLHGRSREWLFVNRSAERSCDI
jgi:hypothetical protein